MLHHIYLLHIFIQFVPGEDDDDEDGSEGGDYRYNVEEVCMYV